MTDGDLAPLDLLRRSLAQTREVVASLTVEQTALPTPCRSWTVGQLIAHLVSDLRSFDEVARGGAWQPGVAEDIAAQKWRRAIDEGAEALIASWHDRGVHTDAGLRALTQQTAEFAVHTWDLARATRQRVVIDAEVAETALAWAQRTMRPEYRGEEAAGMGFGPEVASTPTAPAGDRLAAFFGRDPGEWPSTGW